MWNRLDLNDILAEAGLSKRARVLTEMMVLNRLVLPRSEYAMPDWIRRTALGDIVGTPFDFLIDELLYRKRLGGSGARRQSLSSKPRLSGGGRGEDSRKKGGTRGGLVFRRGADDFPWGYRV
jgi:hypothetical protein